MGISALLAAQILDASATGRSVLTGADASAIRSTLGLGTLSTQSPTGTPSASTFLRGDYSWQTIDLSGYVPYTGATGAVNLGSNAFTASQATLSAGTLNGTVLDIAQTWSGTGTYTGIKYNVTDSGPSNAASLLMDLQVGGTSRLRQTKYGALRSTFDTAQILYGIEAVGTNGVTYWKVGSTLESGNAQVQLDAIASGSGQGRVNLGGGYLYVEGGPTTNGIRSFGSMVLQPASLGSTGSLQVRNSTTAQVLQVYNTFTDASNYERGKIAWESNVLRIGTEKAGTGSARALELQTDGTTRLTITTAGRVELGTIAASANAPLRIQVDGPGRGFVISNSATEYTEFVSGGVVKGLLGSGSVPFAVSNAGDIYFQCNSIEVLRCTSTGITASQNITLSTKNLVTDTTTGTKIGTATTQKLGFYNATPVVQPTAVADATDAASVITQLNALLSRMRNLGLIAT